MVIDLLVSIICYGRNIQSGFSVFWSSLVRMHTENHLGSTCLIEVDNSKIGGLYSGQVIWAKAMIYNNHSEMLVSLLYYRTKTLCKHLLCTIKKIAFQLYVIVFDKWYQWTN